MGDDQLDLGLRPGPARLGGGSANRYREAGKQAGEQGEKSQASHPALTIRHVTTYHYRRPVAFGEHRMMLRPRDSHDQRVIGASLEISPEPTPQEREALLAALASSRDVHASPYWSVWRLAGLLENVESAAEALPAEGAPRSNRGASRA